MLCRFLVPLTLFLGLAGSAAALAPTQWPVMTWPPAWVMPGAGVDYDFEHGRYYQQGAANTSDQLLTVSRASTGYADDSLGNWSLFDNNVLRRTDKGALIEEARTNSIRNSSMQGAVAGVIGSGGVLGTSWLVNNCVGPTITVNGTGPQNGIDYEEIRINGTTGGTFCILSFESSSQIVATYGQTWTESFFLWQTSGSQTNITSVNVDQRFTGASAFNSAITLTTTPTRFSDTRTSTNSATTALQPSINFLWSNGVAVDITFRIGWPQAENNGINSTVASATMATGGATCTNGAQLFTVSGGTGTAATLTGTVVANALQAGALTVTTAGSYTVFPPSPATVTGGGCGTPPTVNLVPTDNSALGFATSPIRTTAAAATRAADVATVTTVPTFGSAYTLFGKGTPNAPTGYTTGQVILDVDDGTGNNRAHLSRSSGSGAFGNILVVGGVQQTAPSSAGTWTQSVSAKLVLALAAADQAQSINGAAATTSATTPIFTPTSISIGSRQGGNQTWNGYVERIALWPSTRLPNASLQAVTQ